MSIDAFQIHAFTATVHGGNPAGVCVLEQWLNDDELRQVAADFGPSVTAFVLDGPGGPYPLRWFTRGGREVQSFCGHATFSAAHVMLRIKKPQVDAVDFLTVSGTRRIAVAGESLTMAVPYWPVEEVVCPSIIQRSIAVTPERCLQGQRDLLLVFRGEAEVNSLQPDYRAMRQMGDVGVIATALRGPSDIVFRFFCPGFSISEDEDHATGSALSTLAPYWTRRLNVSKFSAHQTSPRGGVLSCEVIEKQITISSQCATFLAGKIQARGEFVRGSTIGA